MNLNPVLAMECRKLALAIIYRRLLGDYSETLFHRDLYKLTLVMERLTGVQAYITLAAWVKRYNLYRIGGVSIA